MESPNTVSHLPKFLCIGAQKAATSWLWVMLRQHPGVWMPPLKEIHYFDHLYVPENRTWTPGHIKKGVTEALKWHVNNNAFHLDHFKYLVDMAMENPFTETWYRHCYARPAAVGKVTGDITPEYSTIPPEGIEYVKTLLGEDLKLIYLIRNPASRAISQLKMNLTRTGKEGEGEEFWMKAAQQPVITQRGDYRKYVPAWEAVFPKENILYLPYGEVAANPGKLLRKVEDHLGVSHHEYPNAGNRVHKTREAKTPAKVEAYLKELLAPQCDFIKQRFGEAFFQMT